MTTTTRRQTLKTLAALATIQIVPSRVLGLNGQTPPMIRLKYIEKNKKMTKRTMMSTPLSPALRSGPTAVSGATRESKFLAVM
jgi:hypothetical protein